MVEQLEQYLDIARKCWGDVDEESSSLFARILADVNQTLMRLGWSNTREQLKDWYSALSRRAGYETQAYLCLLTLLNMEV